MFQSCWKKITISIFKTFKNLFWKDFLCHSFEQRKCTDSEQSLLSLIWFNESMCINNKYVFCKQRFLKGVHQTLNLFNNDGTIMKYEQFVTNMILNPHLHIFFF